MMPEENEISLIVESNDSSSFKLRILREQWSQKSTNFDTDFGVKIVKNELRNVLSSNSMMFDFFLELNTAYLKNSHHSFQMPNNKFITMIVIPHY